jgi:glycerophosphoryl diester phosphodiesterase
VIPREPSQLPFFAPPPPRVIAHRGLALQAPENTLEAFRAALAAGATHIETDVHATADGIAVVVHDPDLRRLLDAPHLTATIASLTLAEVRQVTGERLQICTLIEALQTFPSALFNIDVKASDAVAPTAGAVSTLAAADRVLIASFSGRRRRATIARIGEVATSASALTIAGAVIAARLGMRGLVRWLLRSVHAVQIPEKVLGIRTTTASMVGIFHAADVEVHVWTINAPADMHRLLDVGVDGIVTDRCDLLAEALKTRI